MKIQYCSDLHLEFAANRKYINRHLLLPAGEILLLAGDILPFTYNHRNDDFFNFVGDHFENVYWIPGNHEYYGFDIAKVADPLFEKIRSNVFLLNNHTVCYKEVEIICSTLWSNIGAQNEWLIKRRLTDFSAITFNGGPFLPAHFNNLHQTALAFIQREVNSKATSKKVLLTHHVPTLYQYPAKYKKSVINEAFAVELYDFIAASNINNWVYGHHHSNTPGFVVGSTRLLTNQLGYVHLFEHGKYQNNVFFEI